MAARQPPSDAAGYFGDVADALGIGSSRSVALVRRPGAALDAMFTLAGACAVGHRGGRGCDGSPADRASTERRRPGLRRVARAPDGRGHASVPTRG